jgi:hypothetical protein
VRLWFHKSRPPLFCGGVVAGDSRPYAPCGFPGRYALLRWCLRALLLTDNRFGNGTRIKVDLATSASAGPPLALTPFEKKGLLRLLCVFKKQPSFFFGPLPRPAVRCQVNKRTHVAVATT